MQFSESWLRRWCNPSLSSEELCHVLTMAGLEVEEVKPVAPQFAQVVVAQVQSVIKHPDADRLNVCMVNVGDGAPLQIVCGAPNVAAGMKVPCALVGAILPGIQIKQAKVRGVDSHGMLCSARELGLADESSGLLSFPDDAVVGVDVRDYLDLDDRLITLKLTPNRADCLSLHGVARELAALTGARLNRPESGNVAAAHQDQRAIHLDAPAACPCYCGRIVRGVNAAAATPDWMKRCIERSGIRSISALVDITNYVMLELGQPLHAFDNEKLDGGIHVRFPRNGETLTLLNGQVTTLSPEMLVIADERKVLALAGIMGGNDSGITASTRDIFLESAFFTPAMIAGKARQLGFSSDASHRFERGVDFELAAAALERATALTLEICGGSTGPVSNVTAADHFPPRKPVTLRSSRLDKVLGLSVPAGRVRDMFIGLGMDVRQLGEDIVVTPPSFRFDIEIEEDLIEEIARLHGYDNIPSVAPRARTAMRPVTEMARSPMQLRRLIAARDYQEVVTYSFVDAQWETDFSVSGNSGSAISLANPIASQMGVMRTTLLGGLVATLSANRKRNIDRVRIFEIGRCFVPSTSASPSLPFDQPVRLGGLIAGPVIPEQWGAPNRFVDFYDLKADVEALIAPALPVFVKAGHAALHPGRSASIQVSGATIGFIGELHPALTQRYDLGRSPVVFELELAALLPIAIPVHEEISRFPTVIRDLALVVEQGQDMHPLLAALQSAAPTIVRDIKLFDVYHGKGLEESKKSLAFRIVMQDTQRTLEDAEVDEVLRQLLAIASRDFGASLRA